MGKRVLLAAIGIFILWSILDVLIHGVFLGSLYAEQPEIWRPQDEMKMWLVRAVVFVGAYVLSALYGYFVRDKSMGTALKFSALYGLAAGLSFGYGSYAVMRVPYAMGAVWCWGTFVEVLLAGVLL